MLNYYILVNKRNKYPIVLDYETDVKDCCPEVGYIEEFDEWTSNKEEYTRDGYFFNDKLLKEEGIYKIEGWDNCINTPDGYMEDYKVFNITKLCDLPYYINKGDDL